MLSLDKFLAVTYVSHPPAFVYITLTTNATCCALHWENAPIIFLKFSFSLLGCLPYWGLRVFGIWLSRLGFAVRNVIIIIIVIVTKKFLPVLISDPCRGCYMGLLTFIFLFFLFFFPPRFCPAHISGTVTRRDSKLSMLLGPAV